jgi:hypothetical protein
MHVSEDEMEQCAMGRLATTSVQRFEMHLLTCGCCRHRFAEMQLFVAAMQAACREFRLRAGRANPRAYQRGAAPSQIIQKTSSDLTNDSMPAW